MNNLNLKKLMVSRNFDDLIDVDFVVRVSNKKKPKFDDEKDFNFNFRKVSKRNNNKRQIIQ